MESIETIQKEIAELNGFLKSKEKGKNELGPGRSKVDDQWWHEFQGKHKEEY